MKLIPLTKGFYAMVDNEDYQKLIIHKWHIYQRSGRRVMYAIRSFYKNGKRTSISMHQEILSLFDKSHIIDHIDGNGLNNQKSNLRKCTHSDNMKNRGGWGRSKFVGVNYRSVNKKWRSRIQVNGHSIFIGEFNTELEAAHAYDVAAIKLHGQFAKLNWSEENRKAFTSLPNFDNKIFFEITGVEV